MLKKFFLAAIVGLILCAGVKAEAEEVYVGTAPVTGYKCYVLMNTVSRKYEDRMVITSATLKTVDRYDDEDFIDYTFFAIDGGTDDVQFTNSRGDSGIADSYDTPIEWNMYIVIKDY